MVNVAKGTQVLWRVYEIQFGGDQLDKKNQNGYNYIVLIINFYKDN